jgi:polysaccharide chain length determinant protein (PEP-CTERM system associated)
MKGENTVKTVGDYAGLLRRRWPYPAMIIPAGLLVALFVAYVLPVSYRATSTVMQEQASLPNKLVPTTVTGSPDVVQDASEQLELARRRVMTKEHLIEIVKQVDPYPKLADVSVSGKASLIEQDTEVERVDPITLEPSISSTAFTISYYNTDREIALAVADKLLQLYLTQTQLTRAEQAASALHFLEAQATQLEESMRGMEQRLEEFKSKYGNALPDAEGRNLAGTDRAQRDLESFESQIRIAQQRESELQLQLTEVSPSLTAAVGDWRTELARLRGELALAEQKYTSEHPDVKRLRRAIADLAAQGAASDTGGVQAADNPEYLRVKSQLDATRRELDALRASASRARSDMTRYEQNLSSAPGVERQYVQLTRDYGIAQNRYADLQNKIKEAALAQTLESESRGERLTLLRATSAPGTPASPNRLGIILLGFVLSAGIAFLVAVLKDTADPTVRSTDDLETIMGFAPVGHVPVILNRLDLRHRRLRWGLVSVAYLVAAIVVGATVALAN